MKKLFLFVFLGGLIAGCASSSEQKEAYYSQYADETSAYAPQTQADQYAKYQIVDQEFENMSVPNDGYDRVAPYEDQVSGSSYIQSTVRKSDRKPSRNMTVYKTVVDGEGNILSSAMPTAITDQEALPDEEGADLAEAAN